MFKRACVTASLLLAATVPAFGQTPPPLEAGPPGSSDTTRKTEARQGPDELRRAIAQQRANRVQMVPVITGRRLAGFSIVLVQGDMNSSSPPIGISAPAAKALADLKDFLPYKSYQLLDTQWIIGSGEMTTRLQRPGQIYDVELQVQPGPGLNQSIGVNRFILKESTGQPAVAGETGTMPDLTGTERRLQAAILQARNVRAKVEVGIATSGQAAAADDDVASLEAKLLEMRRQADGTLAARQSGRAVIIDSSFRMTLGETVVVGTSRISGDRALIVLLTAVAK